MAKKSHKKSKEKKFLLIIVIVPLLLVALTLFMHFLISPNIKNLPSILYTCFVKIDTKLCTSLISISFTILGFSITINNLIISRDSQKYNNFPLETIFINNRKSISKFYWYSILIIPLYQIIIYSIGFRRQLYIFTILSAVCMILYFHSTLKSLNKKEYKNNIVYVFIENMLNDDKNSNIERKDYYVRLCTTDSINFLGIESTLIFKDIFMKVNNMVRENKLRTNKFIFSRSVIENKINKVLKDDTSLYKLISENISWHFYEYFHTYLINNGCDKIIINFAKDCFDEILRNYYNYKTGNIINKKEIENIDILFFNSIFGLLIALIIDLDFNQSKIILSQFYDKINLSKNDYESFKMIPFDILECFCAIVIIILNYLSENKITISNAKINNYIEIYEYYCRKSKIENFKYLDKIINKRFSLNSNYNSIQNIIKIIINRKDYNFSSKPLFLLEEDKKTEGHCE